MRIKEKHPNIVVLSFFSFQGIASYMEAVRLAVST